MDIENEIVKYWNGRLKKLDIGKKEDYNLSCDTFDYLNRIGMPVDDDDLQWFNITLYDPDEYKICKFRNEAFLVIGDDYGTKICIGYDDKLYSSGFEKPFKRLINKNIACFVVFLKLIFEKRRFLIESDDQASENSLHDIRDKMELIDGSALSDPDNWWSIFLEQISAGLL